ncbi:hypothetical protein F5148DRAFT_1285638 [Russula earlei]|uniref:Uncharacterized protein n=1 Tax=Russula earlei TaxID=71964 RepID=A0ACC0U7N4_9AGAM|nr:hypothetical protein F5148DRAFT_1285638 [Russula earlei]
MPPPIQRSLTTTPFKRNLSGSQAYSSAPPKKASLKYRKMTKDICDKFIRPMPILEFFSEFMPQASQARETNEISFAETSISQCEDQFIKAIQLSGLAPDLTFINTSAKQDKQSHLRPDITIYWNKNAHSKVAWENKKLEWSVVDVWIKNKNWKSRLFHTHAEMNPPEDESDLGHPIKSSHQASHICGQLISYSLGDYCDGIAVVLSIPSYSIGPKIPTTLFEFIWRLNSLTFAQHGYDTTVTSVSENNKGVGDAQSTLVVYMDVEKIEVEDLHQILVNDDHATDGQPKPYITWKPIWEMKTLFGQSTFRYICHNVKQNELVYLKDYWHTNFPGIKKEGDIYHDL